MVTFLIFMFVVATLAAILDFQTLATILYFHTSYAIETYYLDDYAYS